MHRVHSFASRPVINATPRVPTYRSARAAAVSAVPSRARESESEDERTSRILKETTRRIRDLGRAGKPREALDTLASMAEQYKVQPDAFAVTALIDACARNNNMDMARNVFEELFGTGKASGTPTLSPDEMTFAVLLRGYLASSTPQWAAGSTLLVTMERDYSIPPTALTFNALLEACARTNDLERGIQIIERMADQGVEPDAFTLEAVKQRKSLRSHLRKIFG